ncbi:MAG: hypothetical protein ACRC41_01830 [Sarcina sp.]
MVFLNKKQASSVLVIIGLLIITLSLPIIALVKIFITILSLFYVKKQI